ncbi:MAG: ADP-ribosylglycohydrolase family protein [Chloroflexi bacterium]|nr:ADP-ribosylglycohydrolase family protein [Chloroflexota bacterium]
MVAAAAGDALGWPQELRSQRVGRRDSTSPGLQFQAWSRRPGGRFLPYEEPVHKGEYSDDTQLALCTARSLVGGSESWIHFGTVELPLWSIYERGAGGATKRAVASWLVGEPPWEMRKAEDRRKYFEAGGNGVAMRVHPLAIFRSTDQDFSSLALGICANGVATHGHPRALVGGLAHGFALWTVLRQSQTLAYGEIIERLLDSTRAWGALPDLEKAWPGWLRAAESTTEGRYENVWRETVAEMVALLEECRSSMRMGALSMEREVLDRMGCFDHARGGAGTITAAAATFLASRYASDPLHGLLEGAFAKGADTDTLASMTGALLGSLRGSDWIASYEEELQDAPYLRTTADTLTFRARPIAEPRQTALLTKRGLDSFAKHLFERRRGDRIALPDGRTGRVVDILPLGSTTVDVQICRIALEDGQHISVKQVRRRTDKPEQRPAALATIESRAIATKSKPKIGVKIPVANLTRARAFYEETLGLEITKETAAFVTVAGNLALTAANGGGIQANLIPSSGMCITIEVGEIGTLFQTIKRSGATITSEIQAIRGRQRFTFKDPDGNPIEAVQV